MASFDDQVASLLHFATAHCIFAFYLLLFFVVVELSIRICVIISPILYKTARKIPILKVQNQMSSSQNAEKKHVIIIKLVFFSIHYDKMEVQFDDVTCKYPIGG